MIWAAIINFQTEHGCQFVEEWAVANDHTDACRFSRELRRQQSVAARACLRFLLSQNLGAKPHAVDVCRDDAGSVTVSTIDAREVHVSLSHSRNHAGAALSDDGALGFDIEVPIQGRNLTEMNRFMLDEDAVKLLEEASGHDGYALWTRIESLIKMTGHTAPLSSDLACRYLMSDRCDTILLEGQLILSVVAERAIGCADVKGNAPHWNISWSI